MLPQTIVSGGQTGVDRAALDAAREFGLPCGGWCPAGRRAEDGPIPDRYPLTEIDGGYAERTRANVRDSDATVMIHYGALTGGTLMTRDLCRELDRPCLLLDMSELSAESAARRLDEFVQSNAVAVLNVAGPRATGWPGAYASAFDVMKIWLGRSRDNRLPESESRE